MQRKLIRAQVNTLGDREVEVVMSTSALARDGHVLIPQGCQLENYRANPIVLWSHDPDKPIGNAENIAVGPSKITARIRFAPEGVSHKADEICGLMKSGVIRAVSVGFDPLDMEPLDPKKPRGGQRIATWELLELSAVSVPADTGAMVTARAARAGKALSAATSAMLRTAHSHAEASRDAIAGVLAAADGHIDGEGDPMGLDQSADRGRTHPIRAGKMLSAATSAILRTAHDHAESARVAIAGVLAAADGHIDGEGDPMGLDQSADRRRRQVAALSLAHHPIDSAYARRQRDLEVLKLSHGAGAR